MTIEIRKIISRSTGTKTIQPLFWFMKPSYDTVRVKCIFDDPLDIAGIITSGSVLAVDKNGTDVASGVFSGLALIPNEQAVKFLLGGGSVENSPYTIYCRVETDINEKSELKFEMRISRDSTETGDVTFGGEGVTFGGDPDVTFGGE